jgi:TAT (twin-arginine translocation) pathway signal sequence
MRAKVTRRQLLQSTAVAAAGVVLGGSAMVPQGVMAAGSEDDALLGTVAGRGTLSTDVVVQLDPASVARTSGSSKLTARQSVLYRKLGEGDRVAVTKDPDATYVATPLFTTLLGPIERRIAKELTVQGHACSIDDLSAIHDESGDRNLLTAIKVEDLSVGQDVTAVCINNSKSGKLIVEILVLA